MTTYKKHEGKDDEPLNPFVMRNKRFTKRYPHDLETVRIYLFSKGLLYSAS
jgi:hypothetical protein